MTRKPVFRPQADQEVQSARQWYDDQRPGLGIQFADAIDEAVERIASNPLPSLRATSDAPIRSCGQPRASLSEVLGPQLREPILELQTN